MTTSATAAYQELAQHPRFARLLDFSFSDNPLISLAVERREVSWTQFLAWLLDPCRNELRGRCFIEAMLVKARASYPSEPEQGCEAAARRLSQFLRNEFVSLDLVRSVKAEAREGKAGRSDLTVECVVNNRSLTILVENKIRSTESAEQLAKYVRNHLSKKQVSDVLLPVLIQLGDDAPDTSTCQWALRWHRAHVGEWLDAGRELCNGRSVPVPSMINHYLAFFLAADDAAFLKRECWRLIDVVQGAPEPPAQWSSVASYLQVSDQQFFDEVLRVSGLKQLLDEHSYDEAVSYPPIQDRNAGMRISKRNWKIGRPGPGNERMYVHFEARDRQSLELHVEVWPYEGSLHKKPAKQAELAHLLTLKKELIAELRSALVELHALGATDRRLREPSAVNTATAIKFNSTLRDDCTPDQLATFVARVIEIAGARVESIVSDVTARS